MDKISPAIKHSFNARVQNGLMVGLGVLLVCASGWLIHTYLLYYQDRFYPKTFIDDVNVSGLTKDEARVKIQAQFSSNFTDADKLVLLAPQQDLRLEKSLGELGVSHNLEEILDQALTINRQQHWSPKVGQIWRQHFSPARYEVQLRYGEDSLLDLLQEFKGLVDQVGQKPQARLIGRQVSIEPGQDAYELLVEESKQQLLANLFTRRFRELTPADLTQTIVVDQPIVALQDEQLAAARERAALFLPHQITWQHEYQKITLSSAQILTVLSWPTGVDQDELTQLLDELADQVNRPSQDAVLRLKQDSLVVEEFQPDQAGLELNVVAAATMLQDLLAQIETGQTTTNSHLLALPVQASPATITLADTNDLGIQEVIGFGESWYAHSIPNRAYNVDLATARISNHIVRPGAEYSFNKALGEVSAKTGYRDAYIIEGGMTKLSAGGGVCQVSTTLFRSLLDSGVKVSKRLPHAYRVSYYEINNEPGLDATVYAGEVDLRFINDTPGHLLISCSSDIKQLYMSCKLYGTSDGRSTEIINYKKWDQRPALPTVYIDDSSLAPGQLKQIDWSASGIKTEFVNVIRDASGEVLRQDRYYSNYRSWAAKYLRGI